MTSILHCHWWEFWSRDTQAPLGYRRFQIGCVFAEYDLFKPTIFIQKFIYIKFRILFGTVLYQFLETGTFDRKSVFQVIYKKLELCELSENHLHKSIYEFKLKVFRNEISIYTVDAFTSSPFTGNPAAVCLLEDDISDNLKQKIAAEMNISETAFVTKAKGSDFTSDSNFSLRWFTPSTEVRYL